MGTPEATRGYAADTQYSVGVLNILYNREQSRNGCKLPDTLSGVDRLRITALPVSHLFTSNQEPLGTLPTSGTSRWLSHAQVWQVRSPQAYTAPPQRPPGPLPL